MSDLFKMNDFDDLKNFEAFWIKYHYNENALSTQKVKNPLCRSLYEKEVRICSLSDRIFTKSRHPLIKLSIILFKDDCLRSKLIAIQASNILRMSVPIYHWTNSRDWFSRWGFKPWWSWPESGVKSITPPRRYKKKKVTRSFSCKFRCNRVLLSINFVLTSRSAFNSARFLSNSANFGCSSFRFSLKNWRSYCKNLFLSLNSKISITPGI